MIQLDATHDPARRSWVGSANDPATDFPIQNLPYCMFSSGAEPARAGVAIGDGILDLEGALEAGLLAPSYASAIAGCRGTGLNALARLDRGALRALRLRLSELLRVEDDATGPHRDRLIVSARQAVLQLPMKIGGFTDFFASLHHTERGGRRTRPDNPVPANYRYVPIAYNSRASSVRVSGAAIRRPNGQWRRATGDVHFGPTEALDFELELGAFVGHSSVLGDPVPIDRAPDHIFGYCLLNDWSARDIQRWESVPLGPFLAKTLSTTVSPFVVTADALAPYRIAAAARPAGDPAPLPYLHAEADQRDGGLDLLLKASIQTEAMRTAGAPPHCVTTTNFKHMYWTVAQMIAHHTSNGCNIETGDLIGSGTTSGPTDESRACLAEITDGERPIALPNGESRTWLVDGDSVLFTGRAERPGFVPIGFGRCEGRILPAHA
ncbi:fumarylacetoacetase [Chelatococcus reniformis]|uniref:fumarylacetoacetase n=1 Tax=Chelatococcus reniformis TaxID=1494448 RepID=A0A916TWB8_9HYPH|nr:fumarylacetoacetase [Chelatococcus reniformis]GGC45422.1 fumarylacetoacetase [Chelatococcus reniformis]